MVCGGILGLFWSSGGYDGRYFLCEFDGVDIHDLLDFIRKNDPAVHNMALEIAGIAMRYVSECIEAAAVRLVPSVH